tara:strand:- start:33 stop:422 length:390 start_codon:yes stop_codon:yes gene_type:complete
MARKQTEEEKYIMMGEPPHSPNQRIYQFSEIPELEEHPAHGTEHWDEEAAKRQRFRWHKTAFEDAKGRLEDAQHNFLKELILYHEKRDPEELQEEYEDYQRWKKEQDQWIKKDPRQDAAIVVIAEGGKE